MVDKVASEGRCKSAVPAATPCELSKSAKAATPFATVARLDAPATLTGGAFRYGVARDTERVPLRVIIRCGRKAELRLSPAPCAVSQNGYELPRKHTYTHNHVHAT